MVIVDDLNTVVGLSFKWQFLITKLTIVWQFVIFRDSGCYFFLCRLCKISLPAMFVMIIYDSNMEILSRNILWPLHLDIFFYCESHHSLSKSVFVSN